MCPEYEIKTLLFEFGFETFIISKIKKYRCMGAIPKNLSILIFFRKEPEMAIYSWFGWKLVPKIINKISKFRKLPYMRLNLNVDRYIPVLIQNILSLPLRNLKALPQIVPALSQSSYESLINMKSMINMRNDKYSIYSRTARR